MKRKLNIFQIIGMTHRGGSGASAAILAKKLVERGHRVIYVCNKNSLGYELLSKTDAILIASVVMSNRKRLTIKFIKQFLKDISQIRKIIDEEKVDVLHVHCSPEYWIGALAHKLSRQKPVFVRTRHIPIPVKKKFINSYLFNKTDRVITASELIRKNYFNNKGYDESKLVTIYDGVDCRKFNPNVCGEEIRKEFNIKDGEFLIGNIGRLEKVKGHSFFLQSIGEVAKKIQNIKVVIVGWRDNKFKDEDMEEMEKIIKEKGIEGRVIFAGFRNDVEKIMAAIDLFVLSSIGSEGSSRATFEAMAMAKPCVVTGVGILPELIEDGVNGFLIPPENPHLMAEAILKLIEDKNKAKEFGLASYRKVLSNFTDEIMVEKTINLYYKMLEERGIES